MILPNVRAAFDRKEAAYLIWLLSRGDERARAREEARLMEEGIDAILDDPRTLNALMTIGGVAAAPPRLAFYLLARHALLEGGIADRVLADYVASILLEFGRLDRARRIEEGDQQTFDYLVDLVSAAQEASGRRAFMLHAHLGNFALWLSGLFPDWITYRVHRRGAPGIEYYEELGAAGFQRAAEAADASTHGLDGLYRACADEFPDLRVALNRLSDRYLFPNRGDPVDRLLRQLADASRASGPNG